MRTLSLIGRVCADAQIKSTKDGQAYVEFRFANNEYRDKDNTFWCRVVSDNKVYVNLAKYYTKGKLLYVSGDYSNKVYSNKDGICSIDNNIWANKIDFTSSGSNSENNGGDQTTDATPTVKTETPTVTTKKATTAKKEKAKPAPVVADDEDDDLPF